jgi:hypothetical protein
VGLDAFLHGDATDPHVAWLVSSSYVLPSADRAIRMEVVWPPGYRAKFVPKLEVLNNMDQVVLREGDHITGACGSSEPNTWLLEP